MTKEDLEQHQIRELEELFAKSSDRGKSNAITAALLCGGAMAIIAVILYVFWMAWRAA